MHQRCDRAFLPEFKNGKGLEKDYASHCEATNDVAECNVGIHNCERLHSKLGNLLPIAFEQNPAAQEPIKASEMT